VPANKFINRVIEVKLRLSVTVLFLLSVLIAWSGLAYAEELYPTVGSLNALNSGYAITRWPWDGGVILVGDDAQVRACTTDPPYPEAIEVVFRWIRPDGSWWDTDPKPLTFSGDTWKGNDIYDAYNTTTIDMLGDWGVQALFLDEDGNLKGPTDPYEIVNIKAISWHAVPEVPFGTIATLLCMFGALGVFTIKKKRFVLRNRYLRAQNILSRNHVFFFCVNLLNQYPIPVY